MSLAADARTTSGSSAALDLVVRRATPDDLETVIDLRLSLLREHAGNPVYGRLRPDAARRARRIFAAQLAADTEVTFLARAVTEARDIGVLRCIETRGSPLLYPDRYAYISSVFVMPDYRRRGVLRRLLAEASRWARQRELGEMRLHNVSDYPVASEAWQALGFDVVEQVRLRKLD